MAEIITREQAFAKRTAHSLVPGRGYFKHESPLPEPGPGVEPGACAPPSGTKNGTIHLLSPPGGGRAIEFEWVAKEKAWGRYGGNRLAWSVEHLSKHGWNYEGRANQKLEA